MSSIGGYKGVDEMGSDFRLLRFLEIMVETYLSILRSLLSFFVYFVWKSKIHIQLGPISLKLTIFDDFGCFLVT